MTGERPSHPPMRCGSCGQKLVNPRGTGYTHDGPMLDRHGAWPVEEWDDDPAEGDQP